MSHKRDDRKASPIVYGERFGRLIVIDVNDDPAGCRAVRCDCGTEMRVAASDLLQRIRRKCEKGGHAKVPADERFVRNLYGNYKYRARKRGVLFELPYGAFKIEIAWNCVYCGIEPAKGLDQVYAAQGYVPGNTVACCWKCNRAKSVMTQGEFTDWLKRVAEKMHTSIWGSAHPVSSLLAEIDEQRRKGELPAIIQMLETLDAKRK
jgi:hypothetical protein